MAYKKQNKELVVNHFYTEKVEMFDNEFLLFRTTQSKDVWQFRMWNGTTQSYIRKSTRQKDIERAKRVGMQYYKEILATQGADTVNNKKKREKRKGKGCKTLESFYLFEGEVKVYRVAQSGNVWQIYIWIREEQKAIKKSLRTKDAELARTRAKDIYLDYLAKQRYGQAIFDKKAKELTDMYIDYQQGRCKQGSITEQFVKTLKTRMNHYLRFVGENTTLTQINADKFKDYRLFRKEYAPNVKLVTLYNERGTIKALYDFAIKNKLLHMNYAPNFGEWESLKKSGEKQNRDALEFGQWSKIYTYMQKWHMSKYVRNDKQAEHRKFIREYTLILCNAGLRPGEARKLQWRDIEIYDEAVNESGKKKKIKRAMIHLEGVKTKTGVARTAVSRLGNPFVRLKKLSNFTGKNDYVFCDNDTGKQIVKDTFHREWNAMLKDTGLVEAYNQIVYYSLRHTYATYQLYKGVDVYSLAKVMGTSVTQIENHYGHVDIDRIKNKLTKDLKKSESGQILFE